MDDDRDHDDLTAEDIRRVIEGERRRRTMPRFEAPIPRPRARQGRKRPRPTPRSMPDTQAFLDFLERDR